MENLETINEGLTVELKRSHKGLTSDFFETYSSFANTCGGVCYLGIKQEKQGRNTIEGLIDPKKQKKEIIDNLNNTQKVSKNILNDSSFEILNVNNVQILKITIPEARDIDKPIYLNNNITYTYKRNYEGDYLCTSDQIQSMLLAKSISINDNSKNVFNFSMKNVQDEDLQYLKDTYTTQNHITTFPNITNKEFLSKLGLLIELDDNFYLTNAGVLLLTSSQLITQIYPNYFLDYQEKISLDERYDFRFDSDDILNRGNLIEFFNFTYNKILKGLPNKFDFKNGFNASGSNIELIVRESLINAISNCDFILGGIKITKANEYIEFINYGTIKVGLDQALKGGVTLPRNHQIHTLFRRLRLAEKAGTGIPEIFKCAEKENLPTPLLYEDKINNRTILKIFLKPKSSKENELDNQILYFISTYKNGVSKKEIEQNFTFSKTTIYNSLKRLLVNKQIKTNGESTTKLRYLSI